MMTAAKSGGDLRTAFNSPATVQPEPTEVKESPVTDEKELEPVSATEEVSEESTDSSIVTEPEKEVTKVEDIEEITFTDHKGRRTVKVDFSDRNKMKKIASLAYGARKFQVERDQVKQELAKEREDSKGAKEDLKKFESIYDSQGLIGLALMLEGQEGVDKLVKAHLAEQERWSDMTPAERNAELKAKEAEARASKEEESRKDYEKRLAELDARQKDADEKAFDSKLHPAFDRYRYAGKLGDPVAEHRLDTAIWNDVMDSLTPYVKQDIEITQAMIDKEFRKARQEWDKTINKQVDKNTKVAVHKAKTNAQSKAQAKVSQGLQTNQDTEKFKQDINSGNIRDALRSIISGKVKLTR